MLSNTAVKSLRERQLRRAAHAAKRWFWWALPFVIAAIFYRWAQKDGAFYAFDAVALGIAILVLLVMYTIVESAFALSITDIILPEELTKRGWTSPACSNRIADIFTTISTISDLPDYPLTVFDRPLNISVKAGSAEFGSDVFMTFVSRAFGIARNEVSGEVIIVDGDAELINMRLRYNHSYVEKGPASIKDFDDLLTRLTYALAQRRAPLATATALAMIVASDKYRSPDGVGLAVKFAQQGSDRRDLSRQQRALCRGLEALLLFAQLKDEQADKALQSAEEMDRNEIIIKAIRQFRHKEQQADVAQQEETPGYDPLGDSLERLVWTTFIHRAVRRTEQFSLERSVRALAGASEALDQAETNIGEAQGKNWRPFDGGRSEYAEFVAHRLESAESELQRASVWIETHPTDAGTEPCERLVSLRAKLDRLRRVLAEEEAKPGICGCS